MCLCVAVIFTPPLLFFFWYLSKRCIFNSYQSPDIAQNWDGGISNFLISGQFLMNENCPNSRTSNDINIKLEPAIKIYKKNKRTQDCISDAWPIKLTFSLTVTFSYKSWNVFNTALLLFCWIKVLFLPNNADSLQRKCWYQQN